MKSIIKIDGLKGYLTKLYARHLQDYRKLLENKKGKNVWGDKAREEFKSEWRLGVGIYTLPEKKEPKIIFIMQNPGLSLKRDGKVNWKKDEKKEILKACSKSENHITKKTINTYCEFLRIWMKEKNKKFSEHFFGEKLREMMGIKFKGNWKSYIDKQFLKDFHVTDVIKFRIKTGNFEEIFKDKKIEENSIQLLKKEIELVKPTTIFVFSTRTWSIFQEIYLSNKKPQIGCGCKLPEEYYDKNNKINVSNAHGHVFKMKLNGINTKVIPLVHFSQKQFNNYLRNSYFDYLKKCLRKMNKGK